MEYTLFNQVEPFYQQILSRLRQAEQRISMLYLSYNAGEWSDRFNRVLIERVKAGCQVRLMIDALGNFFEHKLNALSTISMLHNLREQGIEVVFFHNWSSPSNRQHIKVCAIDDRVALFGGSNIGDHYATWEDTNFEVEGNLGTQFHDIFESVQHNEIVDQETKKNRYTKPNSNGELQLHFHHPQKQLVISQAVCDLIKKAQRYIRINSWYFLPDKKVSRHLIEAVNRGVKIEIIVSQNNRVPIINILNHGLIDKLRNQGIKIYKWNENYNHRKLYWNDKNQVLCGSANLDKNLLKYSYELFVEFTHQPITNQLNTIFDQSVKSIKSN